MEVIYMKNIFIKLTMVICMTTAVLTFSALIIQGIATSIDALSVGFTIADLL